MATAKHEGGGPSKNDFIFSDRWAVGLAYFTFCCFAFAFVALQLFLLVKFLRAWCGLSKRTLDGKVRGFPASLAAVGLGHIVIHELKIRQADAQSELTTGRNSKKGVPKSI
jgi:hypothetical protein